MTSFIDKHRDVHRVEPVCAQIPIAPSTYCKQKLCEADPSSQSARARRDAELKVEVRRAWKESFRVYEARKIGRQLRREGFDVARCTVERLMRKLGMRGVVHGKGYKTTVPDFAAERPADLVERTFTVSASNRLWVADGTYVATWREHVCVAFVIDVFSRKIVGWRVRNSLGVNLVLDALEQALYSLTGTEGLVDHSDGGSPYLSIRYTARLAKVEIESSLGGVGASYDNAQAENVIKLFKTEMILPRDLWKNIDEVKNATLEWVDWYNNRRLLGRIGDIRPVGL